MSLEKIKTVTLADVSINNKGEYGIGASAVDYSDELYTYLRITDINDDGTLNKNDLKSVDDVDAKNYLLNENDVVLLEQVTVLEKHIIMIKWMGN